MKRILVVNVNWLGDVIFSTPVFNALRQQYPEAHIACLGVPRIQQILQHCPAINEHIVYDEKGVHRSLWRKISFVQQLRRKNFDIVFSLHRSWTRSLLMALAGIPERVGYNAKGQEALLTHHVLSVNEDVLHRRDIYLKVIESYGVPVHDRTTQIHVRSEAKDEIESILRDKGYDAQKPLVLLNTGGNWDLKQWVPERFAQLTQKLVSEHGVEVVIPGADKDKERVDDIIKQSGVDAINLSGQTTIPQLIALMEKARLVVSADSGPLHMAHSVGTDVVALFGPTRPENTGPCGSGKSIVLQQDVGCNKASCYYLGCSDNVCMQSIEVDDVCQAVKQIMC